MKKISLFIGLLIIAVSAPAAPRGKSFNSNNYKTVKISNVSTDKSEFGYESIRQQYAAGRISADSLINLALYHKVGSPALAERCLSLVGGNNPRAAMELGVLYAFTPEYASRASEGVRLLQSAANAGYNEANGYLGLYYFNHNDYTKAKTYFDACRPMKFGFGDTALGSMYLEGKGVKADAAKAREYFHQAAFKGYPRGAALYGFNMRASAAGRVSYPDSFFWLYIAGDLGDDAARATLSLPLLNENRGNSETARKAQTALQFIELARSGKKIQNDPIYKDGFLPSLKSREKAAEQGDDWARYYLGSMNYNGDFLNQNYARAIHYYEPIVRNGKLPKNVLAVVHERLAKMYGEGKGIKANPAKAAQHTRQAAHYGNLPAYKTIEGIR